jgi:hypothetical protein
MLQTQQRPIELAHLVLAEVEHLKACEFSDQH